MAALAVLVENGLNNFRIKLGFFPSLFSEFWTFFRLDFKSQKSLNFRRKNFCEVIFAMGKTSSQMSGDSQDQAQDKRRDFVFWGKYFAFSELEIKCQTSKSGNDACNQVKLDVLPGKAFKLILEKTAQSCTKCRNSTKQKCQTRCWD